MLYQAIKLPGRADLLGKGIRKDYFLLIKAFEGGATQEIISSAEKKSTRDQWREAQLCYAENNCWTQGSLGAELPQGPVWEQMLMSRVSSNGCHRKERSMLMQFNDGTKEGWTVYIKDSPNIVDEMVGDNEKSEDLSIWNHSGEKGQDMWWRQDSQTSLVIPPWKRQMLTQCVSVFPVISKTKHFDKLCSIYNSNHSRSEKLC